MTALSFPTIDFEEFHRVDLPRRIEAGNGALAADDIAGVSPIAFKVPDGGAFSYVPGADGVEIWATDVAADTVVEISREAFSDFANELHTCFGLLYAGLAETSRGDFAAFERWEPALRALYHGRPIIDPSTMDLPADLARPFSLDDPDHDTRGFLHRAGFLHLRGVFDPEEIDAYRSEVEVARAAARPDDGHSWWATRADGEEVCCRVTYLERSSPTVASLAGDARMARIAALGAEGLVPEIGCLDGLSVVIKHPEITAGLSDLPWHRDCGLGGHPVLCPSVAIGIQLDPATAATGQLHFLAGSHLGSSHPLRAPGREKDDEATQPTVAIDTEPGDVTVHFGHVLHAAPSPTGTDGGRRALYVTSCRPETMEFVGEGNGYNDVLFTRDGQVHNVDELLADA